jgi:DNA-binding beta-propeller fold protein YncE
VRTAAAAVRVRAALATGLLLVTTSVVAQRPSGPGGTYWVYVANESSDLISLVRFDRDGAVEAKTIPVGIYPADIEGAHGLTVSPTGQHWFVTTAHGTPYGKIWKFETGTDRFVDSVTVGLFPATMSLTPDGSTLFVVNFDLHGDPVPSSVSAVFTPFMREMRQIPTCVMPHGSRVSRDGTRHYSTCMMSDQLVEIATDRLDVNRRLLLTKGSEHILHDDHDNAAHSMGAGTCKPTWVVLDPSNEHVYVPCNGRAEILEIRIEDFTVTRTFATGAGPYNADVSADGRLLVVTLKGAQAVAIVDLASGQETRVPTTQPVTHGVTISPDSRYAFVSNESIGATRGTLDVFDLVTKRRVASTQLQYQSGGIAFWKMEPATTVSGRP